jgi:hypothetical protein
MTRDAVTSDQLPAASIGPAVLGGRARRRATFPVRARGPGPGTGELVDGDIAQQADQILRNIAATLAAIGKEDESAPFRPERRTELERLRAGPVL